MLFGASLLLSVLPFIILLSSLGNRRIDTDLSRHIGLSSQGARIVSQLFRSSPGVHSSLTNLSATAVTLRRVGVVLPLGGLKMTSQAWGPCGELPGSGEAPGNILPPTLGPGASAWFTVTFQVLVRCLQPLPVQFTLHYNQSGRRAAMPLPGFPDLGQVPYSGCR